MRPGAYDIPSGLRTTVHKRPLGIIREEVMQKRCSIAAVVLAALLAPTGHASAWDDTLYPNLKGQWRVVGGPMRFDTGKPWGPGQQAPLTPEYQAIFEANLKAQAGGSQGKTPTYTC